MVHTNRDLHLANVRDHQTLVFFLGFGYKSWWWLHWLEENPKEKKKKKKILLYTKSIMGVYSFSWFYKGSLCWTDHHHLFSASDQSTVSAEFLMTLLWETKSQITRYSSPEIGFICKRMLDWSDGRGCQLPEQLIPFKSLFIFTLIFRRVIALLLFQQHLSTIYILLLVYHRILANSTHWHRWSFALAGRGQGVDPHSTPVSYKSEYSQLYDRSEFQVVPCWWLLSSKLNLMIKTVKINII